MMYGYRKDKIDALLFHVVQSYFKTVLQKLFCGTFLCSLKALGIDLMLHMQLPVRSFCALVLLP